METLSNAYYLPNICKFQMLKPSLQSSIRIKLCYLSAVSSGNFLKIEVAVLASNGGVPDFFQLILKICIIYLYIIWPILKWIEWTSYFCYYEPFQKDLFCFCCPHHFYISQVKSFEDLAILFIGSIIMYFGWEMKRFFCFSKPSADVFQDVSLWLINSCIFERVVFKINFKAQ